MVIASCIKAMVKRATIFKVKVDILNTGTQKEVELKRIAEQKLTNNLYHHLIICSKLPETSKQYRLFLAYFYCDNYSSKAVAALPGGKESFFFFNSEYGTSHGSQRQFFIEFNENLNGPLNEISNARAFQRHPAPDAPSLPQGAAVTSVLRLANIWSCSVPFSRAGDVFTVHHSKLRCGESELLWAREVPWPSGWAELWLLPLCLYPGFRVNRCTGKVPGV